MGLFSNKSAEALMCDFCNTPIKGLKILSTKTQSGRPVCMKCFQKYNFGALENFHELSDDELERYINEVKESDERYAKFKASVTYPGYSINIDPANQWLQLDGLFYVFDIDEVDFIVMNLTLDSSDVKGTLDFYFKNHFFPFYRIKVTKAKAKGLLRSSKIKNLQETISSISASLGDVPIMDPKEAKKLMKMRKKGFSSEQDLVDSLMEENRLLYDVIDVMSDDDLYDEDIDDADIDNDDFDDPETEASI